MKLVSMAKKPEKEEKPEMMPCCAEDSKYPYGLVISLCNESLMALGIGTLPVGTVISIMAKGKVTSASESEMQDGEVEGSMSIQITDLGLEGGGTGINSIFGHPSRMKEND